MKLGYSTITWGGVVGTPGGVTSIKDLFYRAAGSTVDALHDIANAGYTGTEMFDGNLLEHIDEPQKFSDLLDETKLTLVGVYTGANFIFDDIIDEEFSKIERAAMMAATFGAECLVVGGGAQRANGAIDGDFERLAAGLNRCSEIATSVGLRASYHPHLGTLVETPEAIEQIMGLTSIRFCPDTAHLAGGGGNPAVLIRQYGDRLAHVHLKDRDAATGQFRPLGDGDLDFVDILLAIREAGYDDWLMIELDYYLGDPRSAATISKKYLDTLFASQPSSSH